VIAALPSPVEELTIPERFSPSGLSQAIECPLRCVLQSRHSDVPRLPRHPSAERGAAFHALLERAGKGVIPRSESVGSSVQAELDRLLEAARERLSRDSETAHFAELKTTLSEVDWHNKSVEIIRAAERLLEGAPRYTTRRQPGVREPLSFARLVDCGTYHEVRIESADLRLEGRVDLVEFVHPTKIVLGDYKTGRVFGREGAVRDHISLQLRMYALAAQRTRPSAEIELRVIEGALNHLVEWNDEIRDETESVMHSILAALPSGVTLLAENIARPGAWCSGCSFRHVCSGYMKTAPPIWGKGSEAGSLPLDVWGTLKRAQRTNSGISLDLVDAAGRNVRLQRIDDRHGATDEFVVGKSYYFFGLAATHRANHVGVRFHPRNFFELPSDRATYRAWSLAIFRG